MMSGGILMKKSITSICFLIRPMTKCVGKPIQLYVSAGLHDSQVQYWEPAKWVAKLRELKTDNHPLYLDTNMDAGHGELRDALKL